MRRLSYHAIAAGAMALSVLASIAGARWADVLHRTDRWHGWLLGMSALAIPVLTSGACLLWLYSERENGQPAPAGYWLWVVLIIGGLLWLLSLLFSLL